MRMGMEDMMDEHDDFWSDHFADIVLPHTGKRITLARHYPLSIWQERSGEYSYRCACGTVVKHQPFGQLTEHA